MDDTISETLRKEFCEEALCSENATQEERELVSERLEQLFSNGIAVSKKDGNIVAAKALASSPIPNNAFIQCNFHVYFVEMLEFGRQREKVSRWPPL